MFYKIWATFWVLLMFVYEKNMEIIKYKKFWPNHFFMTIMVTIISLIIAFVFINSEVYDDIKSFFYWIFNY